MNMSTISMHATGREPVATAPLNTWLQSIPAKRAAQIRMQNLKHFTACPPRPISRAREPLPHVTLTGVHGGQAFPAEDWHYGHKGLYQDRRVRSDRIAGDLGR